MPDLRRIIIRLAWFSALCALPFFNGCGYHTAGRAVRLSPQIAVIAIPGFTNQTRTYRLEQRLTQAVVREFLARSRYRIVNQEDPAADATLKGVITSAQIAPVTNDTNSGRVSSAVVLVSMQITLVDSKGHTVYQNLNYAFREQYQVSREISSFFEEESPAVERLAKDFAHTLVSDILEAY